LYYWYHSNGVTNESVSELFYVILNSCTLPIDININRLKSARRFFYAPINYVVDMCTDVWFKYCNYRFLFVRDHAVTGGHEQRVFARRGLVRWTQRHQTTSTSTRVATGKSRAADQSRREIPLAKRLKCERTCPLESATSSIRSSYYDEQSKEETTSRPTAGARIWGRRGVPVFFFFFCLTSFFTVPRKSIRRIILQERTFV